MQTPLHSENHRYKTVKYIRNDDDDDDNDDDEKQYLRNQSTGNNTRSMSSGLRNSIRQLTSCASARRKPGRNSNHVKSINDSNLTYKDEQRNASAKSSSTHKQPNRPALLSIQSPSHDIPPALPPRKPLDKKNSAQTSSAILNSTAFNQSSTQLTANNVNETSPITTSSSSILPPRVLPSKEISTSLVNLMGTASDSIGVNNSTQSTKQEPRRISTAPSTTVDRLGLFDPLSNISTNGMVESPSSHRTVFNGSAMSIPYTKSINDFTWCYESSNMNSISTRTSVDECLPQLEIDDKPLIYRQQFESTEHFNWYGTSESQGHVIISYKHSIDQNKQRSVMSIVRTRQRTLIESFTDIPSSMAPSDILHRICEQCAINDVEYFDPVLCDGAHDLLLKYDESHVSNQHKFGIIYQRENQLSEEDIFSNETHSVAMDKFLNLIGTRVKLKDFRGFRGGLDVKCDQTGVESVYEQFHDHEIMFHVSTLLPHSKSERQQLERKRHIGNDIVAIVFQETETLFNPECIASQFLHVYLVVTPLDSTGNEFKVSVIHRDSVPPFGPNSNLSTSFHCDQIFKQWILTKLINAEMASCRASTFQKYQVKLIRSDLFRIYSFAFIGTNKDDSVRKLISQYKHECELEQQQHQREETQNNTLKTPDRHGDSSLLGSVRRRFIAPKLRVQNPASSPATTIIVTTPPSNDARTKTRSMTMDLRRSASRESITTNGHGTSNGNGSGKMALFFSSSKNNSPRIDKSMTNRSLADPENLDSSSSSRFNSKLLSPATCPSSPWTPGPSNGFLSSPTTELSPNVDSSSQSTSMLNTSFSFNHKFSSEDTDNDNHVQLIPEDLQASSKEELIKCVLALQQQHSNRIAQMDQIHSNALRRLELQLMQQQNAIDRDSP
ncbi:unnamed protein product [Adineta ricciae]|uniref:Rap-GAP domain-containing protein n=1 Tax=Adineta ricciae TaxID=249248 RepID=A0A814TV04_ADIRI|nr:unnamed protein product [Adineta ricciae]